MSPKASALKIATMSRKEVAIALEWAREEGWNPAIHDASAFYTADPGGFLLGRLDGEPVATISAVRYGETFGFLGLYIVKISQIGYAPKTRGRWWLSMARGFLVAARFENAIRGSKSGR